MLQYNTWDNTLLYPQFGSLLYQFCPKIHFFWKANLIFYIGIQCFNITSLLDFFLLVLKKYQFIKLFILFYKKRRHKKVFFFKLN